MNFKKWIQLEGKALSLSQDMINFAKETATKIFQGWEYDKPIHSRQVKSERYGTKNVIVFPRQRPQNDSGAGYSDPQTGEIGIYLQPNTSIDVEEFMQHELIHIFDPKLTNEKLRKAKWGIDSQDSDNLHAQAQQQNSQYYGHTWEQDAFMRQSAEATIKNKNWLFDGDQNQIAQSLQSFKPQDPWEKFWYKNKKMWRKYLNTLYSAAIRKS